MGKYFGRVWVNGSERCIILGGWECVRKYFGWVQVDGFEWG